MVKMRGGGVGTSRTRMRREDPLDEEEIPDVNIYCLIGKDWYSIKAADCHKYETYNSTRIRLQPAIPRLPECIHDASFAADGSIVFASGGLDRSHQDPNYFGFYMPPTSNKVFYIDTVHPQMGWTAAPPMNVARYQHKMLADGGKMYVFGGLIPLPDPNDGKHIFAEVYDPLNCISGWEELACVSDDEIKLPQTIYGHAVVGEHDGHLNNRMILFHAYNYKGLYYLGTNRQQFGVYDDKFGQYYPSSTFLDGVLYFLNFNRNKIYAYDISTSSGEHEPVVLCNVETKTLPYREEVGESMPTAKLQSLGNGHLALVWVSEIPIGQFVDVHCSIIKMSKEDDLFVGDVLICSTYSVKCGELEDCMVV